MSAESIPNDVLTMLEEASEDVLQSIANSKEANRQPNGNHIGRLNVAGIKVSEYTIEGVKGKFPVLTFPWKVEETDNPAIQESVEAGTVTVRHRVRLGPYKNKQGKLVRESIELGPYKALYRAIVDEEAPEDGKVFLKKFLEVGDGCRANLAVEDDKKNKQYQRVYINGLADES